MITDIRGEDWDKKGEEEIGIQMGREIESGGKAQNERARESEGDREKEYKLLVSTTQDTGRDSCCTLRTFSSQ